MTGTPIRVLLVDDHAAIRAGMRFILEAAPDVEVVGEASDGNAAVANATALRPDVVLMDVRMPGMDGIAATRTIVGAGLAQVLILTTFDIDEYIFGALRAGAAGFLLKTAEPAALLDAVRRVAAGDAVIAPEATRRLLEAYVTLDRDASRLAAGQDTASIPGSSAPEDQLTDRETEVLALIAEGLSNRDISLRLTISAGTTKTHVSRILTKLGCRSRTQAAIIAREERLV
ncbi:response regulator transcription factor [Arthrobacter sp. 260]|uniref:response regulator n=1 Tax=Arthrobacter sp. 260 TaxID=2735314 RepID=UPI0014928877|nr:response regulator transcription factor [Arthrobacter sp. 260]NOJ59959.1 response regulator transcription factor [Arthrobacter sp. 260]